ncbi:transcriptional regulator [Rhizobium sp. Root1203]|uniref:LysR substrate-binding domain-containing protein n=1 Tax=Rhizobium sp. Root1203 TaxID=1736427 RepID=UPI0007102F29|nr:LysR substrate-binding domain-containing protein [Rhizobium sp. Root1203]KQV32426.1 transcriptional regulator [Rhizobium sp. Root1203]
MKRGRLPLTALRTFEVAGRLRSFTAAADELFVSQAAVSRQVRELEAALGHRLFERKHRSVALTPHGERLLSVLTDAFDRIGDGLESIRNSDRSSAAIVSSEPSFAACWLLPRLPRFQRDHPDIDIVLDVDPRLIEFRTDQATIAIRHSARNTHWPRVECRRLIDVTMVPVIAPDMVRHDAPLTRPSDLLHYPLIHEENRDLWQSWFDIADPDTPAAVERGMVYPDSGLVLQATLRGQGVGLIDDFFVREEISAGRLIQPFATTISHGAYWIVARHFDAVPAATATFIGWMEAEMRDGS